MDSRVGSDSLDPASVSEVAPETAAVHRQDGLGRTNVCGHGSSWTFGGSTHPSRSLADFEMTTPITRRCGCPPRRSISPNATGTMNHAARRLPFHMSAARDRVASPSAPGGKPSPGLRQAVTLRRQSQTSAGCRVRVRVRIGDRSTVPRRSRYVARSTALRFRVIGLPIAERADLCSQ